jgi:hypothetical protein
VYSFKRDLNCRVTEQAAWRELTDHKVDKCEVFIKVSRCVREVIDLKKDNTLYLTFVFLEKELRLQTVNVVVR